MPLFLRFRDKEQSAKYKPAPVTKSLLANLALTHAGDGGRTERGTMKAMAWQRQAQDLKDGDKAMPLNKKSNYEVFFSDIDETV